MINNGCNRCNEGVMRGMEERGERWLGIYCRQAGKREWIGVMK